MTTLYLKSNKVLCTVTHSENYQGENSFETLRIVSATEVSERKLSDCTVECHIINPSGEGDIIRLAFVGDDKPTAEVLLSKKYTAMNGDLTVFLKLFCEGDVIGLTNEVTVKIRSHRAVTSYIPDSQLTLLDQYSQTLQKAENIINDGLDDAVGESVEKYLSTHEVVDELTAEDISVIF